MKKMQQDTYQKYTYNRGFPENGHAAASVPGEALAREELTEEELAQVAGGGFLHFLKSVVKDVGHVEHAVVSSVPVLNDIPGVKVISTVLPD